MEGGVTKYNTVVSVIRKTPGSRNDFEVNELIPWFRKRSKLFESLKTEILFDVIKNVSFLSCSRDDILIREGDKGDCMYIILRGSVGIYRLQEDVNLSSKSTDEILSTLTSQLTAIDVIAHDVSATPALTSDITQPNSNESIRETIGERVAELGENSTFGDVALMSEDCIRTATVIVDELSDFIVFDRDLYNRSVKFVLKKEFEDKTNFIASSHYFRSWQPKYRKQLAMAMVKETVPFNCVLAKQGDPVDAICFILTGEVKVTIDAEYHKVQYPKLFTTPDHPIQKSPGKSLPRKTETVNSVTLEANRLKRRNATIHGKRQTTIEVCLLGINESIGDVEVLMDLTSYLQTATCTQRSEVLVLGIRHFERLFTRRHPRTIDQMIEGLLFRLQCRLSPHLQATVPVLPRLLEKLEDYSRKLKAQDAARRQRLTSHFDYHRVVNPNRTVAEMFSSFIPQQGALIDLHGVGTVFNHIRQRERVRLVRLNRGRMTKWRGFWSVLNTSRVRLGGWLTKEIKTGVDSLGENCEDACDSGVPGEEGDNQVNERVLKTLEERMKKWHMSHETHALDIRERPLVATLHRTPNESLVQQAAGFDSSRTKGRGQGRPTKSAQREVEEDRNSRKALEKKVKDLKSVARDVIRAKAAEDKDAFDFMELEEFENEILLRGNPWV